MARLEFKGETIKDASTIKATLAKYGIPYEQWGLRDGAAGGPDELVLKNYDPEVAKLKQTRGYKTADLIALKPTTPNLDTICAKFDKEHHHVDDEVRFTVEGEGVFEIQATPSADFVKFTAEPGDLIIIPANRRHFFYLTATRTIRCIRLFKTKEGWEAIYPKVAP